MGDPTRSQRILAPADTVIAYGIAAVANAIAQALGQAPVIPDKSIEPALNVVDLMLRLMAESEKKAHVLRARALWLKMTKADPSLVSVSVMDLEWWVANVPKAYPSKKPIGDIGGYDAWTNSSTLVLVAPSLFDKKIQDQDLANEVATVLLRHEAKHVDQFRKTGDKPPASYQVMADFEAQAYGQTSDEFDKLATQKAAWNAIATQFADDMSDLADDFAADMKLTPDSKVREEMVKHGHIPGSAPTQPADLYMP